MKSDAEWKKVLSKEEFRVIREKGTEGAFSGTYDGEFPTEGYFGCRACEQPLYTASSKFNSGCGWPAFDKCIKDSIQIEVDNSFGMRRVEIMCNNCGGHLGHVFHGERKTDTDERHCVNSVSIKYFKAKPAVVEEELIKTRL